MKIIGYIRCSTEEQHVSGLGLQAQETALRAACRARGWKLVRVERDVSSGRRRTNRPGLDAALASCRAGEAHAIMAAKLDRFSRSVVDFYGLVQEAERDSFAVILADSSFDMTTATGRAMAGMLAVFAQWEGELIGERTRAALAVAKVNGTRSGRPIGRARAVPEELRKELRRRHASGKGESLRSIARSLNEAGVAGGFGGRWTAETVARVIGLRAKVDAR